MPRGALAAILWLLVFGSQAFAAMPRREPPLLLGGPKASIRHAAPVDPRLPTGAAVGAAARPPSIGPAYCSFKRPVCVHEQGQGAEAASAMLEALAEAYEHVILALGLPEPLADAGLGGSDALDTYLLPPASALLVQSDPPLPRHFSEASGFCELPTAATRSDLQRSASLCIAELLALRLDASETPHLRRAFATSLWWLVGHPTALDAQAIDDVQAHPELAVASRELSLTSEGAGIFFNYLESARSAAAPGELSAALLSAAVSPSSSSGLDYVDEPDVFDVLRHSLEEDPARFAALMVDFAVSRAFVGARDDGLHLPELAWSGAFGRVRFDWKVLFSSLPRHLAIQPPIESSGSVVLWLELDEVPLGASLGLRVEWEAPVTFQWQLVRVGAQGEELSRVDIPFQERGRSAEARMTNFEDARAVLIVGTNLEGIEVAHPFDPDVAPFEPHGAILYLTRL